MPGVRRRDRLVRLEDGGATVTRLIWWTGLALVAAAMATKGIPGDHTDPCTRPDPPAHCRWATNHLGDR